MTLLVALGDPDFEMQETELFPVKNDLTEIFNLAEKPIKWCYLNVRISKIQIRDQFESDLQKFRLPYFLIYIYILLSGEPENCKNPIEAEIFLP